MASGAEIGPLHGIPVTVKDSFDMEGLPTTCGSRLRRNHRAPGNAVLVNRLRRAGAVILGKTNCPEFLVSFETDNDIVGRTNNPWNLDRTPGGSSGGESAAIAAFFSAGGLGSDGGGSIRFPAHSTGIVGLKPTPGRCPATGHFPDIVHPGALLAACGPMARTADDARVLFEALAGHYPRDPLSAPVPIRPREVRGTRIGVMHRIPGIPAEAAIPDAVRDAAGFLVGLGLQVEECVPRCVGAALDLWRFFFVELPLPVMRSFLSEKTHWTGREMLEPFLDKSAPSSEHILEQLARRDKMRAALMREMEEYPVLLWPAANVAAFPHRQRDWPTKERPLEYFEATAPLVPANVLGLPSIVVPITLNRDRMPIGVQLIARPWEEELLLEMAVRLEEIRGPFPHPPGY
jgi:Asp-tRNA(Asn)/Glu-tRNA(Gln) amidotransferase A subunit family amidase